MNAGAGTYAATEAANASPLPAAEQDVLGVGSFTSSKGGAGGAAGLVGVDGSPGQPG